MGAASEAKLESETYLANEVRTHDRARYLTTLFAKPQLRPHLIALLAFEMELSRIPGLVSEPQLGDIRYEWWRDQIAGDEAGTSGADGPVAQALLRTITEIGLAPDDVVALVDAHQTAFDGELDEEGGSALSPRSVESAARRTHGGLNVLMARVLGEEKAWALDAAREAGAALGMVRFLWGTPEIATLIEEHGPLSRFQNGLKVRARLSLRAVTEYGAPNKRVMPVFMAATLARYEMRDFRRQKRKGAKDFAPRRGDTGCMMKLLAARLLRRP